MGKVIHYHEDGMNAIQLESNREEKNFNVVVREINGENYSYAGILLSRKSALELIAKLTAELAKTV